MASINPKLAIYNKVRINPKPNSNVSIQPEAQNEPDLDQQLSRLEEEIRRLKIDYDVYFSGGSKRPPHESRGRVEAFIKRIADSRLMRYAQRYKFNALVARYNSYRELWRRTFKQRGFELLF